MKLFDKRPPIKDFVIITSESLVKMYRNNPESIKGAKIILPTLGSSDFGKFQVPLNPPTYSLTTELLNEQPA